MKIYLCLVRTCSFHCLFKNSDSSIDQSIKTQHLGLEYLDLCSSINAFKSSMVPQLNFLAELDNLKTFRKNFDGDNNIRFPMGIESLSTKSVLTESFCRGINILEFDGSTEEKEKLAMLSFEMVTKMIFLHDFIHGGEFISLGQKVNS